MFPVTCLKSRSRNIRNIIPFYIYCLLFLKVSSTRACKLSQNSCNGYKPGLEPDIPWVFSLISPFHEQEIRKGSYFNKFSAVSRIGGRMLSLAKRKARCGTNFHLVERDATFCQVFEISRGDFEPQAASVFRNIQHWQKRSIERHGTFNWNGVPEDSRIVLLTPVRGKRTREFVSTSGHYMFDLVICKNAVFGTRKFRACWITSNAREQRNSASFWAVSLPVLKFLEADLL